MIEADDPAAGGLASRLAHQAGPPTLGALYRGLCRDMKGPLVADADIAALSIEHGCELVTTDGDFARFPGLRWRHPLAAT